MFLTVWTVFHTDDTDVFLTVWTVFYTDDTDVFLTVLTALQTDAPSAFLMDRFSCRPSAADAVLAGVPVGGVHAVLGVPVLDPGNVHLWSAGALL